jgi:hypothetical protein
VDNALLLAANENRSGDIVRRAIIVAGLWVAAIVAPAASPALETDQYYAWGRPLADATDMVNARLTLELERAIGSFPPDRPPKSCRKIAAAFRARLRFVLLHDIQIWAWNTEWVDRIPDGGEAWREYTRTNLYSQNPPYNPATWMPYTPTIEVAGVRMGTDKLAHFVSSGWTYYSVYSKALEKGETRDEAARSAVHRGIIEESLMLGKLASGVLAIPDLEASFAGMHFYTDLCGGEDPILELAEDGWVISRPIDLRDYVTPRWDESFQPSVYTARRWHKIRPVLETYCDRLDDPQVVAMRRSYRERDTVSMVDEMVAEQVRAGKIADPSQFSIEAVCERVDPSLDPAPNDGEHAPAGAPAVDPATARERIVAEESDRRRFALGLPGLHITYPLVASASIAVMAASQPRTYDCTTPCDLRGFFAELEPGLGGGKLSLGWARVGGRTNRKGTLLRSGYIGIAYKFTLLRTWGDIGWVEGGRTYAGFELGVPVAQANVGIGLLYRVDGGDDGRWIITGGAGWGF